MPGIVKLVWKSMLKDSSNKAHYRNHVHLTRILNDWRGKLGETFDQYYIHVIPETKIINHHAFNS